MNYVQAQKFKLSGSGCTSTATSIILTSMKLPDASTNIAMADFGTIGFATIEPGTSKEEQISFTGISINVDTDVATLTGVSRGLRFVSPYDVVSANKKSHAGGSIIILSNTAGFYGNLKDYIDTALSSGAVPASTTVSGLVEIATQAEVAAGTATGGTGSVLVMPNSSGPVVETTTGTTHSLTTVASQRVIVWAKGDCAFASGGSHALATITVKYNSVTKDTVNIDIEDSSYDDRTPFSLMYTETPGAATANIVLATDVGSLSNTTIIVLKL